jgi:hypothetical protein
VITILFFLLTNKTSASLQAGNKSVNSKFAFGLFKTMTRYELFEGGYYQGFLIAQNVFSKIDEREFHHLPSLGFSLRDSADNNVDNFKTCYLK